MGEAAGVRLDVTVEATEKKAFASVLGWPGWCRSGRTEDAALDALLVYRDRYDVVAREAGLALPDDVELHVVERLPGTGTTAFGAPDRRSAYEDGPVTEQDLALLQASWRVLDRVVAGAPETLRKGPRGGGRDRDAVATHVREAQHAYARSVGVRLTPAESADMARAHAELLQALRTAPPEKTPRYWVRRATWHVLDHAWEIEDKSD
ncbi:MAG: hypothetical protein M3P93_05985 [Actinomycetota bacterium]|nr:hypothetical protein [Actinomycetota bacterium]